MQTAQVHVNAQSTSPATIVPPPVSSSYPLPHALSIPPPAATHPRGSSIPTPPPSAHPHSHSHQPSLYPSHGHERVFSGDSRLQHANRLTTHVQTPQHVLPNYSQQQHQQQRQQQQVFHAENGVVHAQLAPTPPPPPLQIVELKAPNLRPSTLPQQQQQQQQQYQAMTHPTNTVLTTVTTQARPSRTPSSSQTIDTARFHGPQYAQPFVLGQTPPRGSQAQLIALVAPRTPGTQTPQRGIQPHTQAPERPQTIRSPLPAPSPSSTQAQAQLHAQQQRQQEHLTASPAIAAFRVLQPAKALFEKTWSTAIAAVQQELVVLHSEHGQSVQEQQRFSEELQRMQADRAHILQALQDERARLRESIRAFQFEQKARLHLEKKLVDMSAQCTCGVATAKKLTTTAVNSSPPPSSSSSSSPLPSFPVAIAPPLATAEDVAGATPTHSATPTTASFLHTDKPRELRREREEETVDGETASKRRRITPISESVPPPTSTAPAPEPEAAPTPGISEAQKAAESVVPPDKNAALRPQHTPLSTPAPESTHPEPNSEQERSEDPPKAAIDGADSTSAPRKIGIQHIQLAYETVGDTLQCRMCLYDASVPSTVPFGSRLVQRMTSWSATARRNTKQRSMPLPA